MKKIVPIICMFGLLSLILQVTIQYFIKEHKENYAIITKDNSYQIEENYMYNKKHIYEFNIKDKYSNKYIFEINNNFHKKSNIIKDIKFYKYKDIKCIYPIYKNKFTGNLSCNYKNNPVTVDYLKTINNKNIYKIIKELKKDKYNHNSWNKNNEFIKYKNISLYKNNIPNNVIFTMWNYKGFDKFSNRKEEEKILFDTDIYENNVSYISNSYMIIMGANGPDDIDYGLLYIYDLINGGKSEIYLDNRLSKNIYFNGTYKNKIYLTDISNKIQYIIDPRKDTIKEIGNENIGYKIVLNNKLINATKNHFLKTKYYFNESYIRENINNKYKNMIDIYEEEDRYYLLDKDFNFYRVYKNNINNILKLFKLDDVKEWIEKDDSILVVANDTAYYYDDINGLVPIIKNKEFIYNYKNICNFVKK